MDIKKTLHDLRNLFSVVQINLSLLDERPEDDDLRQELSAAIPSMKQLLSAVEEYLRASSRADLD